MDPFGRFLDLVPQFFEQTADTLMIVGFSLLFGGIAGLFVGVAMTVTRKGGVLQNAPVFWVLNTLVNIFRPIPFIIFIGAVQPLAKLIVGTTLGNPAVIVAISVAATFGISRLVEQNLVGVDRGLIEAARSMGAGPWRIIRTVILPEGLGPLILGYTFAVVALIDMSAVAGFIGGSGIGNFAIVYGYRQFNPWVTWACVLILILIVQVVQALGNWLARRIMRQ